MNLAGIAMAGTTATTDDVPPVVPQESFLSSLKQAFNQDFDHAVVFGHFDVGTAKDAHRYYCLLDTKTGKRQPNGVAGVPLARPDGMTGIKVSAVSLYSCSSAEQQGLMVTEGYVLNAAAAVSETHTSPPAAAATSAAGSTIAQERVDVAGVKLGMALDQVRAALKSKQLPEYYESTATLSRADPSTGIDDPIQGGRFVNVVAAWSAPPATPGAATAPGVEGTPGGAGAPGAAGAPGTAAAPSDASARGAAAAPGEFYEVQFTPEPGKERAMVIVHSVSYPLAGGVRESMLDNALAHKYGAFGGSSDFPDSPTWRIQSSGEVQLGDTCNRRGFAHLPLGLRFEEGVRSNPALTTAPEEFRYQLDHCGVAIVTEDHVAVALGNTPEERVVTRFTITAYGPAIAALGASAARQLIQGTAAMAPKAPRADSPTPAL